MTLEKDLDISQSQLRMYVFEMSSTLYHLQTSRLILLDYMDAKQVSKVEKEVISNGGKITRMKGRLADAVFAVFDCYKFELIERNSAPEPLCGIMLHIGDLQRSVTFYKKVCSFFGSGSAIPKIEF